MNDDLTQALVSLALAAVSALTLAITVFAVPWLKGKVGEQRVTRGLDIARVAVRAAEQMLGSAAGPDKQAYADEYLAVHAPWLKPSQRVALIESAVLSLRTVETALGKDIPKDSPTRKTATRAKTTPITTPPPRRRGPDGRWIRAA